MKPQTIGKKIIEMTGKYSRHKMFDGRTVDDVPTLALYSTKELPGLARALAKLGELLSIGLRDEKTRELVKDAAHSALSYGDPSFKDLKSFVHELDVRGVLNDDKGLKLKEEIARSLDRISPAMFRGKSSDIDYSDAGPLSVFIPILLRISICIII
ncbi:MAG: hypothetical protein HYU64_16290 [Armatimonadetes bacterium]|nr:hypothetical protein [Armatimonadota bacterium]